MAKALPETHGLTKRFGGLTATNDVSLSVEPGELLAAIGPNGAGKTTLIAELSGQLRAEAGTIRFAGPDISRLGPARRAALGIGRSFQITSIFREFTTLDNVALAVQAQAGHSFRFLKPARRDPLLRRTRHRPLVPDHLDLSRVHHARQCRAGGAGAGRTQLPLLEAGTARPASAPHSASAARSRSPRSFASSPRSTMSRWRCRRRPDTASAS